MGTKIEVGTIYRCPQCGYKLKERKTVSQLYLPIRFGRIIKKCPNCQKVYIDTENMEFFTVNNSVFYKMFLMSLFFWAILVNIVAYFVIDAIRKNLTMNIDEIFVIVNIVFIVLYYILFRIKWNKEIKKSINRVNDSVYLIELVLTQFLTIDNINYLYKNGNINTENYEKVMNCFKTEKKTESNASEEKDSSVSENSNIKEENYNKEQKIEEKSNITEDKYDKLVKLRKLLDDGTITKEEFDIEKKKLLQQ